MLIALCFRLFVLDSFFGFNMPNEGSKAIPLLHHHHHQQQQQNGGGATTSFAATESSAATDGHPNDRKRRIESTENVARMEASPTRRQPAVILRQPQQYSVPPPSSSSSFPSALSATTAVAKTFPTGKYASNRERHPSTTTAAHTRYHCTHRHNEVEARQSE